MGQPHCERKHLLTLTVGTHTHTQHRSPSPSLADADLAPTVPSLARPENAVSASPAPPADVPTILEKLEAEGTGVRTVKKQEMVIEIVGWETP